MCVYDCGYVQVVDDPAIDADEQFFWELNGFIVLRVRARFRRRRPRRRRLPTCHLLTC